MRKGLKQELLIKILFQYKVKMQLLTVCSGCFTEGGEPYFHVVQKSLRSGTLDGSLGRHRDCLERCNIAAMTRNDVRVKVHAQGVNLEQSNIVGNQLFYSKDCILRGLGRCIYNIGFIYPQILKLIPHDLH